MKQRGHSVRGLPGARWPTGWFAQHDSIRHDGVCQKLVRSSNTDITSLSSLPTCCNTKINHSKPSTYVCCDTIGTWHFHSTVCQGTPAKVCHVLVCACQCASSNALARAASVMPLTNYREVPHGHWNTRIPRRGLPPNIVPLVIASGSIRYRFFHLGASIMKCMATRAFRRPTWCSQVHDNISLAFV